MSRLVIRGGRVIDPAQGIDGPRDVLAVDGMIEAIEAPGRLGAVEGAREIDASGRWIVPGLIDAHVHLRDPGFPAKETIATGLTAAAAGGFTAVAAMANTSPVNDHPAITHYMLERAASVRGARLIPVGAVTRGLAGRETVDFDAMAAAGARLFSDDGIPIDDPAILAVALKETRRLGLAISLHEEDRGITGHGAVNEGEVSKLLGVCGAPVSAETARVRRDLEIARLSGGPVHIAHVSAADSLDMIRAARRAGIAVTCEVTPHHFALDDSTVLRFGTNAKMAPPLRSARDVEAVERAVADGTIDMIATDHAPHDPESKQIDRLRGFFDTKHASARLPADAAQDFERAANGIVGIETSLGLAIGLIRRSIIDARRMVELMSLNPARLLRIQSGSLERRGAADITIIDPEVEWTVTPEKFKSKSGNTPFIGMRLVGRAAMTIVGGEIVYDALMEAGA